MPIQRWENDIGLTDTFSAPQGARLSATQFFGSTARLAEQFSLQVVETSEVVERSEVGVVETSRLELDRSQFAGNGTWERDPWGGDLYRDRRLVSRSATWNAIGDLERDWSLGARSATWGLGPRSETFKSPSVFVLCDKSPPLEKQPAATDF